MPRRDEVVDALIAALRAEPGRLAKGGRAAKFEVPIHDKTRVVFLAVVVR